MVKTKKAGRWMGALLLLALAGTGCTTLMGVAIGLRVKMRDPFPIINQTNTLGWGHYDHPFLWKFPDCVVATYNVGGETVGYGARVTQDEGKTWTDITAQMVPRYKSWFHPISDGGTNCLALQRAGTGPGVGYVEVLRYDGYRPVEGLVLTSLGRMAFEMPPTNEAGRFIEFSYTGSIDAEGYWYLAAYFGDSRGYSTKCYRKAPGENVLRLVSTIATRRDAPWGMEGPCEPTLVALPQGELVCIMRTGAASHSSGLSVANNMLLARSHDRGLTWKTRMLAAPGVRPHLVRMQNGVLACSFGRPGNHLILSADGGRTWPVEMEVAPVSQRTGGYSGMAEVSPDRLLYAYDMLATSLSRVWLWEPPSPVNGVFARHIEVRRTR